MKSEHEKRLEEIEAGVAARQVADWTDAAFKWLIERLREAEAPIPHCKISELHPGDTIVFKCPEPLSMSAVGDIEKTAAAVFGNEYPVIVLDGGLDLEIVRPKSTAESEAEQEPAHMAELRRDAKTNRTAAMLLAQSEAEAQTKGDTDENC